MLVRLEWRARREPEYGKRIGERMGRAPARIPPGCIWFHAVSAGESIAVAPLIAELAREFPAGNAPPFLVTATTPAGSAQVSSRLGGAVHHCYAPYDFRFAVRRFFDRVRPRLLVLVETELWPNLIDQAHRRGVPVLVVNARLSKRSARGYRFFASFTRSLLRRLSFVACQYEGHLERFRALGLGHGQGEAFGSVKFDARLPRDHPERVAALRRQLGLARIHHQLPAADADSLALRGRAPSSRFDVLSSTPASSSGPRDQAGRRLDALTTKVGDGCGLGQAPVWVAGSTHPGEDELVLEAHARVCRRYPESRLLLVPRHPVRGKAVCGLARERGFTVLRLGSTARAQAADRPEDTFVLQAASADRPEIASGNPSLEDAHPTNASEGGGQGNPAQVFVCDIMGRLQTLYGLSQVAFLGGSLVPVGGHNPIEAALCGQPLVMGPHTFNFDEVVAAFARAQCLTRVETPAQLADAVTAAFDDDAARTAAGARALQVVEENRGATERLLDLLRTRIRAAIG